MKKIDKIVTGVIFGVIGALCIGGISSHYDKINSNKVIEQRDIFIENSIVQFDNICLESDDYLYTIDSNNNIEFKDGKAYARLSIVNNEGKKDTHPFVLEYVKQSDGSYKCQNEEQIIDKLDDLKNDIENEIKENKKLEAEESKTRKENSMYTGMKFGCEQYVYENYPYVKINESYVTDIQKNGICNYVIRGTKKGEYHNFIFTYKVDTNDMTCKLVDFLYN